MAGRDERRRAIRDAYIAFESYTPYVMTVGELVQRLSAFDPASPVVIEGTCPHGAYMREIDIYIDVDQGPTEALDEVDLTWTIDEERERLRQQWSEANRLPPPGANFP